MFSKNRKKTIHVDLDTILYIRALENYVAIYNWENNSVHQVLLRNTISDVEKQFENTSCIRCHRSFMINVHTIFDISGNNQTKYIQFEHLTDIEVPVSKKYIAEVLKYMKH